MNKKLGLAVAGALLAFGSSANAGITIPAGDWTIDIGGNVNAYYTNTRFSGDFFDAATKGMPTEDNSNTIGTGLLPAALGIGGKTRQNDLDIAFQFTFFTGTDSVAGDGGSGQFNGNGAQPNSLNIRQAFMTFGDASWGTIKMGRDLGIFGSDAILSDMTLLGVGTGGGGNGNSTLGRIGSGYLYADWVGQISYWSPNWNGFSFGVGLRQPWGNTDNSDLGFDGKASYEWGGDYAGKAWVGYIHQKVDNGSFGAAHDEETADAWEIGGKVNIGAFGLVGYYYDGEGFGGAGIANLTGITGSTRGITPVSGLGINGNQQDVDGGYIQGTFTVPNLGTKIGLSWGQSNVDGRNGAADYENESWIVGAYHPLTKSVNLVAEYTDTDFENISNTRNNDGEAKTFALGAIMFF